MTIIRHVAGAPASQGGEFRAPSKPEASVALPTMTDDEYNAQGTFLFPPKARSLKQHIQFWTTVPVSDGILNNISATYQRVSTQWRQQALYDFARKYDSENQLDFLKAQEGKEAPDKQARRDAAIKTEEQRLLGLHPDRINPSYARDIARACRLYDFAAVLPREDREKAQNTPVNIGPDVEESPQWVVDRYFYDSIYESFEEPTRSLNQAIEALARQLE